MQMDDGSCRCRGWVIIVATVFAWRSANGGRGGRIAGVGSKDGAWGGLTCEILVMLWARMLP